MTTFQVTVTIHNVTLTTKWRTGNVTQTALDWSEWEKSRIFL